MGDWIDELPDLSPQSPFSFTNVVGGSSSLGSPKKKKDWIDELPDLSSTQSVGRPWASDYVLAPKPVVEVPGAPKPASFLDEIIAQAGKAQTPAMNVNDMLGLPSPYGLPGRESRNSGSLGDIAKQAIVNMYPVNAIPSAVASLFGNQKQIEEKANKVIEERAQQYVDRREPDWVPQVAMAIPQAIGGLADPLNAAMMAAGGPAATKLGTVALEKTIGREAAEKIPQLFVDKATAALVPDVAKPAAAVIARKVGNNIPAMIGSVPIGDIQGMIQTKAADPNASMSDVVYGGLKNTLVNSAMETFVGSAMAQHNTKSVSDSSFADASRAIVEHDQILKEPSHTGNTLDINDINYRPLADQAIDLYNRRTGETVGGGVNLDGEPHTAITANVTDADKALITKTLLNRLDKMSKGVAVPQVEGDRSLASLSKFEQSTTDLAPGADPNAISTSFVYGQEVTGTPAQRAKKIEEINAARKSKMEQENPLVKGATYDINNPPKGSEVIAVEDNHLPGNNFIIDSVEKDGKVVLRKVLTPEEDLTVNFNKQPEVIGSGPEHYEVQRWQDLRGSNPLRGGTWYKLIDTSDPSMRIPSPEYSKAAAEIVHSVINEGEVVPEIYDLYPGLKKYKDDLQSMMFHYKDSQSLMDDPAFETMFEQATKKPAFGSGGNKAFVYNQILNGDVPRELKSGLKEIASSGAPTKEGVLSHPLFQGLVDKYNSLEGKSFVPDPSYRSNTVEQFNSPGREGGSYLNQKKFAPSNPLVLDDVDIKGAASKTFLKKAGFDVGAFFKAVDQADIPTLRNLLEGAGVDPKDAQKLVQGAIDHGDTYPILDRTMTELARKQGYDAVIRPQANEYVDLTRPAAHEGASRVIKPESMGFRKLSKEIVSDYATYKHKKSDVSGFENFRDERIKEADNAGYGPLAPMITDAEHGVVNEKFLNPFGHDTPEHWADILAKNAPDVHAESVNQIADNLRHSLDQAGGNVRLADLNAIISEEGVVDPAKLEALYARAVPAPTEDMVNQAIDSTAAQSAPEADASTPGTPIPPEGTMPPVVFGTPEPPPGSRATFGRKNAFTMLPKYVQDAFRVARKNLSWENTLGSADIASAKAGYNKRSVQRKAIEGFRLMEAGKRETAATEMGVIHSGATELNNAIQEATDRAVAAKNSQGEIADPAIEKARIQREVYDARQQRTPDLITDPALKDLSSQLWSKVDGATQSFLEAVPKSMRAVYQDLMGSYMERKYAINVDDNFAAKISELSPEKVDNARQFFRENYGMTDDAEIDGAIQELMQRQGVIPNRAGQSQVVKGVSPDLEWKRNLSDEARGFWDRVQGKEADLANEPTNPYDLADEFDSYLGSLRKSGKEKLADSTYAMYLEYKKNNPKISDRNAIRLAWEDQSFPPVLRDLIGEVKDPATVYQLTAAHTIERATTWRLMKDTAQKFAEAGLLSEKPVAGMSTELSDPDFYAALGVDKSQGGKLYASPEIKAIFDGLNDPSSSNPLISAMVSAGKFGKVMSVRGLGRQVMAAPVMVLANGDAAWAVKNPSVYVKEIQPQTAKGMLYFLTGDKKYFTPEVEAATRLGVLKPGAYAGEMIHFAEELKRLSPQAAEEKLKTMLANGMSNSGKAYGVADAWAMMTGYQIESRKLAWARGTGITPEILKEAAESAKNTYQNTSRVPPWAAKLSKNPFSAGFISFTAEMWRNAKNMAVKNYHYAAEGARSYKQAVEYAKAGDMASAERAAQASMRLGTLAAEGTAQLAGTLGAAYNAKNALKKSIGIDDDKEVAFRNTMAYPGSENSTYWFTNYKPGKSMEAIDTSSADPYDPITRIGTAMSGPGTPVDKAGRVLSELSNEFLSGPFGMGLFAKALVESVTDTRITPTGPKDIPADQKANGSVTQMAKNFASKALVPSQFKDVQRLGKALKGEDGYSLAGEALHTVGLDRREIDFGKRMADRTGEFATGWQSLKAGLDKATTYKVTFDPKLQKEVVGQYADQWNKYYTTLRQHVQNAKTLGMKYDDIAKAFNMSKVGNSTLIDAAWEGNPLPLGRYLNATEYWDKQSAKR